MKRHLCIFFLTAALAALCVAPAHGVAPSSASLASANGESSLTTLGLLSPQSLEGGFAGAPLGKVPFLREVSFVGFAGARLGSSNCIWWV